MIEESKVASSLMAMKTNVSDYHNTPIYFTSTLNIILLLEGEPLWNWGENLVKPVGIVFYGTPRTQG